MTLHSLFIVLHAISGLIAFAAGWITIGHLRKKPAPTTLWLYLGGLIGLVIFMIGAILSHWLDLANTQRLVYLGLTLLGLYMLFRAYRAYAVQQKQDQNWALAYVEHVGFTLISLFDGFVIVAAIDLGVPAWGVVAIGFLGVVSGIYSINRTKSTLWITPA
jgi:hypothetical protein